MTVSAVIQIEQYGGMSSVGDIQDFKMTVISTGHVQDSLYSISSSLNMSHLVHVSTPLARVGSGWPTVSDERWSDSPTRQPNLLYRWRFSWGRDRRELFDMGYGSILSQGADGSKWGSLDEYSGLLMYEKEFPISATGEVRQFRVANYGRIQSLQMTKVSSTDIHSFPGMSGDVDIKLFPYLLTALPVPYSYRNPVDTDVYARLASFTFPIASGTISLYINNIQKTPLHVEEFLGGLGGFDVTWENDEEFDYDSQVSVRWEFYDTDSPPNRTIIKYPFNTVPDQAAPRVINLVPSDGSINVPVKGPIQFDLTDYEGQVDISTLKLYVNNIKIANGVNGDLVIVEKSNNEGYTIQFIPYELWLYGDLIPVALFVTDDSPSKNELFFSYSFTTEESKAPRLINLHPNSCTVEVPTKTHILVDVIDGGHGLDTESIVFTVEEIERGNTITLIPVVHRDE